MKLDVEGFELEVLKGADHLLATVRPSAIILELASLKSESEAVVDLLNEYDYQFVAIPRNILRMRTLVPTPDNAWERSHDIVAAPKGATYERMRRLLRAA